MCVCVCVCLSLSLCVCAYIYGGREPLQLSNTKTKIDSSQSPSVAAPESTSTYQTFVYFSVAPGSTWPHECFTSTYR